MNLDDTAWENLIPTATVNLSPKISNIRLQSKGYDYEKKQTRKSRCAQNPRDPVSIFLGVDAWTEITSNVVYKFTCLCDASLSYIGKTKRHLVVRSDEHLRYEKEQPQGEIKTHLRLCEMCERSTIDNFQIVKKNV